MNDAHIHLVFNHFPITGTILGVLVLIVGLIAKNTVVRRTALGIMIFSGLMAIPAFLSGEGAEEVIEETSNISHDVIEEHEELAEGFIWAMESLALIALITLYADIKKWKASSSLIYLSLLAGIVIIVYGQQVATTGGEINHPEIRDESAQQKGNEHEEAIRHKGENAEHEYDDD